MSEHTDNGRQFLDDDNAEAALAAFDEALAADADDLDARYGRAEALARLERTEDAIAQYREGVALEPRGRELASLAELLLGQGTQMPEVAELLDQAIELDPDQARAYILRADLHTREGDFERADALLRKGIRRGGELPETHIFAFYQQWVGQLVQAGQPDKASEVATSAARFHAGPVHLIILAGGAAEAAHDAATAIEHYKAALDELPEGQLRNQILEKIAALA